MDDPDGGREPELARAIVDRPRVFGVLDAAAEHRIDVDVEPCVLLQMLQLLVQQPEALLRHVVGLDVVDADLQEIETGRVQLLDALRDEEVAVRDEAGHHPAPADVPDERVELGMEHRLAAAEGDHRRAERRELVYTTFHQRGRHGRRHLVVLVAVAAVDVAAADRDDLHEERVGGVDQPARELPQGARLTADRAEGQGAEL